MMSPINPPIHLVLAILISVICIGVLLFTRTRFINSGQGLWLWRSLTLFFVSYCLIVSAVIYIDISADLALQAFDLNGDGSFSQHEITSEQKEAMHKVIADNARNFSFITALIFSAIITLSAIGLAKIIKTTKR